jgi:hypothetical protein
MMTCTRPLAAAWALATCVSQLPADDRIPAFARRYGVSCTLCHNPIPTLTAFGEQFGANGFRMSAAEPPRDTVATGDVLLELMRELPLAVRLDAYVRGFADGNFVTDFQLPYNVKLLSGGPIATGVSYYFYFFLFERGEIGGIEDAFVYFNDIGGLPLDIAVGQFQVSDPLFKRELRLEYQDYAVYRMRIGAQPADFAYDRGIMVAADVAGFTLTGEIVNGNGRGEAEPNRRLDNDAGKSFVAHVTRDVVPGLRLGALGYWGRQAGALGAGPDVGNTLWMVGGDATVSVGPLELNGQYLRREDGNPTFTVGEPKVVTQGGFAELILRPRANTWYGYALYNRISADRPLLNVRLGGPSGLGRYETVTGGAGYLLRRNLRIFAEATRDRGQRATELTLGLTTAF